MNKLLELLNRSYPSGPPVWRMQHLAGRIKLYLSAVDSKMPLLAKDFFGNALSPNLTLLPIFVKPFTPPISSNP
jgi:hypothetical protein